jgi:hypothetical protein
MKENRFTWRFLFYVYITTCTHEHHVQAWSDTFSHQRNQHTPGPCKLDQAGGLIYRRNVFEKSDFQNIQAEFQAMARHLQAETTSSVAHKRRGLVLSSQQSVTVQLFRTNLQRLVQTLVNPHYELSTHVPVEIRTYDQVGAGMAWHVDDVLYDPPQVEVIYTLENNSDCATLWKQPFKSSSSSSPTTTTTTGISSDNTPVPTAAGPDRIERLETEPNSVILLRAGGPSHCVTSLTRGRRIIVKCAFAESAAPFLTNHFTPQQFGSAIRHSPHHQKRSNQQTNKNRKQQGK